MTKRLTDGRIQQDGTYTGGKTSTFAFDPLGREQEMRVEADGEATRSTFSDYWPSSDLRRRRTERASSANDTVERWFRFSDGRLSRLDRKRQGAADFAKHQAYDYDLNGNRVQDERGSQAFNARDQLVRWTKRGGGVVDYTLNGSGGILSRSEGDTTISYAYKPGGERVDHAIVTIGGASARTDYHYDAGFGDITGFGVQGQPPLASFTYDPFGRLRASDRDGRHVEYTYDGIDRRDTRMGETRTFDYSYVGLSEALSQEQEFGGEDRRSYDYTSRLERLGMARRTSATGTAPYRAYSKDANGSVEGLEDPSGEVAEGDRYRYDPYGQALAADESPVQNDAGLSDAARANGFRFQGHLYDSASDTYDMQARAYLPELGRFLQEDHFEDALGELALEADPLTQDRYAFGGGNPVNTIEFDGHIATTSDQHARNVQTQGGDVIDREQGRTVSGPNAAPGPDRSGFVDRYDPGASSSPYLARQIVSSPAAEPVLGELSFDRLKRGKVTHLLFLLDQVEPEERRMRVAASEGGGLGPGEAVEVVGLFANPCKLAAVACRAAAGAAARAGLAAGKTIGETAVKAPGWIAKTLRLGAAKGVDDLAKRVPPYAGAKTQGALDVGGRRIDLISGLAGPAASIPKGTPGFDAYLRTHVEGHAAAILRQQGGGRARLAINQVPCPNCHRNLPHALPEGAELEVIGPEGFRRIYRGLPD